MIFIQFIDYFGTLVFAISGVLAAAERKFDLFGAFILGLVTAVGGGTLRDIMIGSTPVGWMTNPIYVYITICAVIISIVWGKKLIILRKGMFVFDTLGIGLVTILGLEKTLSAGLSPMIAVMMGVVSAVFGGVIRDILSNQIPLIFRKEIYAFACFAGALCYLILTKILQQDLSMILSIMVVIFIRVIAVKKLWSLPFSLG